VLTCVAPGQLPRALPESEMLLEIKSFIIDCQARRLSPRTIDLYTEELSDMRQWLEAHGVERVEDITPTHLRTHLLDLANRRNPGGVHVRYRVAKTFLRWWEAEHQPDGWHNPIARVKGPKLPTEALAPVTLDQLRAMLDTCKRQTFMGDRDRAILLALLDTGCRAAEFLALDIRDVNLTTGTVMVRHGKGDKARVTFMGAKSRKALLAYLRHRPDARPADPLWVGEDGRRLKYDGLVSLVRRRAAAAGVPRPALHSFRRGFAILSHRAGTDVMQIQKLLGHSDLSVLRRYLRLEEEDLRKAHERGGPVDNLL